MTSDTNAAIRAFMVNGSLEQEAAALVGRVEDQNKLAQALESLLSAEIDTSLGGHNDESVLLAVDLANSVLGRADWRTVADRVARMYSAQDTPDFDPDEWDKRLKGEAVEGQPDDYNGWPNRETWAAYSHITSYEEWVHSTDQIVSMFKKDGPQVVGNGIRAFIHQRLQRAKTSMRPAARGLVDAAARNINFERLATALGGYTSESKTESVSKMATRLFKSGER